MEEVLESIEKHMRERRSVEEMRGQGQGSHIAEPSSEGTEDISVLDVEHRGVVDITVLIDIERSKAILEGLQVELSKKRSFRGTDLGANFKNLDIVKNFNGTLGNLGGNVKSLKERGLGGFKRGDTGMDGEVDLGHGAGTGSSFNFILVNDALEKSQVSIGENETNVSLDKRKNGFKTRVLGQHSADGLAHHGVLSHKKSTLASEGDTDGLHELGADVVRIDNQDFLVLVQVALELGKVASFALLGGV